MKHKVINDIKYKKALGLKSLAVLLDPDKVDIASFDELIINIISADVDYIFVGGSLISSSKMEVLLHRLLPLTIPKILFPGDHSHIYPEADGILYLSLISGRNPDYLIGQHVLSAAKLKKSNLEVIPTGYILVDGGKPTTVSYISNTNPVPNDKPDIAAATAVAGELLGFSLTYLDTGSGALQSVHPKMVKAVKEILDHPIIVGGGIRTASKTQEIFEAGADLIVIGTAFEENPSLLKEIAEVRNTCNELVDKN